MNNTETPSAWNSVALAGVTPMPWKNGGGTTRELLAWPTAADWRVRLSVAEVAQDGPFSSFPGVQRWFAVLDGAGVRLTLDGDRHALTTASAPFAFDGGAALDCSLLDGVTQDFNLMARGAGKALMQRLHGPCTQTVSAMSLIAIYDLGTRGSATFGSETVGLEPHTLAWRLAGAGASVRFDGQQALWMEVSL